MGVPAFYRWLANKYPNTVVNAVEEKDKFVDFTNSPNPNGIEFDNLYLDMNGIIHPCFHPADDHLFPPVTFEEVFRNIFEYIDRLFNIVRPRKLLYLAIDGVAPRAKMNQQRARRFQTSKHYEVAEREEERLRIRFQAEGKEVLPKTESETSDSNVITPGTEFMYRLSKELENYIRICIKNDPGWKDIKVILSDANVPGEGEHKIMSFIRLQRTLPNYNPNARHCLYGLDADLIMLALATHEVRFSVLREDVFVQDVFVQEQKPSCESAPAIFSLVDAVKRRSTVVKKPYQFLHVWILREYLELDMKVAIPPEKFDLERVIDDFIFICFFVGNDFLPHMPTLEIHEGAIDLLMHVYKTEFNPLGDYLVDMERVEDKKAGYIKLSRVEKFILKVGSYEEKIFKKRSALRDQRLRRIQAEFERNRDDEVDELVPTFDTNSYENGHAVLDVKGTSFIDSRAYISDEDRTNQILQNTKELKEKLKVYIRKGSDTFKDGFLGTDKVKLGSLGWKERYYKQKFSAESREEIEAIRKSIVEKYTEGLCWVLRYYFSGVCSWTWFYPYHYGPFASDMKGISQTRVKFERGSPFKPFDQLLGVLPPRSAHALPLAYQPLMSDENSEIIDFYPTDFEVDMDGKRFMWQGISKLSFIDEERLLAVTRKLEKELNGDEAMRNAKNSDQLFVRSSSDLGSQILLFRKIRKASFKPILSEEFNGFMGVKLDYSDAGDFEDFQEHSVLCVYYELPPQCHFIPRLLEGINVPEKTISESDIEEMQLWHEYQGNRPNNRVQYQQQMPKNVYNSSGVGFAGRGKQITTPAPSMNQVGFCTEGIQNLKISNTNRGFESYGRGHQQVYNNARQNRYYGAYVSNTSTTDERRNGYFGAATSAQGFESYGRAHQQVYNNERENRYYGAATSAQGRGRGQYVSNANARENRYYGAFVANTSTDERRNVQSNARENRYYGAFVANTSTTDERRNVQSNARENRYYGAATSAQGRGRGQCVSNANAVGTSWIPRKSNMNYGVERDGRSS